jgi:hypothetical protein
MVKGVLIFYESDLKNMDDLSLSGIPDGTPIVLLLNVKNLELKKYVEKACHYNFRHPVVINKKDFYKHVPDVPDVSLCLSHMFNKDFGKLARDNNALKDSEFVLENYAKRSKSCHIQIVLDQETIRRLKQYSAEDHLFGNREITGGLRMTPITKNMFKVSIDDKKTKVGEAENADIVETISSFHSHPLSAYHKYKVCMAFPSADDYITTIYLYLVRHNLFHIVASIEGMYIITINEKIFKKEKKDMKKYEDYIIENYGIDYPVCRLDRDNKKFWKKKIKSYLKKVNRYKYFYVQFVFWEDAGNPIDISYQKIKKTCILSDEQYNLTNLNF